MKCLEIFENAYENVEKEDTGLAHEEVSPTLQGSLVFSFMHRLLICVLKANLLPWTAL